MAEIKVLDQDTINQIAAGEVVERPSSIVKELVENAIDASSTAITVEIKSGGIDFIRITDNGCGIDKDQIRTAFLPHATSKIGQASDLATVGTLGFRGEALASISAVSKVEMVTKTDQGISGIRYLIEGGQEMTCEEVGCPEGTTIIVRNLFYNTPARRKFLKSSMTEAGYVEAFLQRLSLSHPDIAFKFINENRMRISTSGNGNLKDAIYHIYGREVAGSLLPVDLEDRGIRVTGFIGKPVISRGNRNYENYFVNGRYLKNRIITRGIEDGYKGHAMVHKFPFCLLMISMDPLQVDVNVHPAKMEMRFHNGEDLYQVVEESVRTAFLNQELIPRVSPGREKKTRPVPARSPEPFEKERIRLGKSQAGDSLNKEAAVVQETRDIPEVSPESKKADIEARIARLNLGKSDDIRRDIDRQMAGAVLPVREKDPYQAGKSGEKDPYQVGKSARKDQTGGPALKKAEGMMEEPVTGRQLTLAEDTVLSQEARPRQRIIGQVFGTFWLMEYEDKLFFVDQHAAHEKVMYEKLMKRISEGEVLQQQIAPPLVLNLSVGDQEKLEGCREALSRLGFTIEDFGQDAVLIRAVPLNLYGMDEKAFFLELFDGMEDFSGKLNLDHVTDRVASMACKAAVKGNSRMSVAEMDALMEQLMALDNPYQCPHGRPTIISMSRYEIEKKFKRVQT